MDVTMTRQDQKAVLASLSKLRSQYNPYVDEDIPVIDAIDLLSEEINFNVKIV